MTLPFHNAPSVWEIIGFASQFAAGGAFGILHFRSLWWNVRRFTDGGNLLTTIALIIGRFVLLAALMTLASLEGALPLLASALGVLVARFAVMRRVGEATP